LSKSAFFKSQAGAPVIKKHPETITQHGQSRTDNYAWLRDKNWQEVLQDPDKLDPEIRTHLELENAYYESSTHDLTQLREALFEEMRSRIKEDDSSIPAIDGPFAYGVRFETGGEYPIYFRRNREIQVDGPHAEDEILYHGDIEGKGAQFFDIASVSHSPDHNLIAYGVDRLGSEYFDIKIRNIKTGEEYEETIPRSDGDAVWSEDSKSFYYIERDENQRPKRVKHHFLGEDPKNDRLIYEEDDDGFFLSVYKSRSGKFIFIDASNSDSGDVRFLPADTAQKTKPVLIAPRRENELYSVDHHRDHLYIQTNANDAIDFKIMRAPIQTPGRENWQEWLPHQAGTYILSLVLYENYIVRLVRENALPKIIISDYERRSEKAIEFQQQAYALGLNPGYEFDTDIIRFSYSSPSTPEQTFDYHMRTGERTLLKTQIIPRGHNPDLYRVERLMIPAARGGGAESGKTVDIPVTVIRLKNTNIDGNCPLLLYGYGSYGSTMPASFNSAILSVVDREAVYAIAHIRGSAAKGRQWYLDGKLDKKPNTFSDFATVARALQEKGYGQKNQTVIYGGSAGGLLVGATLNLDPDLFGGVIGAVPFIDVLNTISDKDLPLTPPEWDEWGNPITDSQAFETIASYSPYENLKSGKTYPPVLATGGLTDYRVTYWEPAKWIARLREETKGGPFFLKMNMGAGHGGSTARFERLKERAHDYAFALALFDLSEKAPVNQN